MTTGTVRSTHILPMQARLFERAHPEGPSRVLARTDLRIAEGEEISILDVEAVIYDHRDQVGARIQLEGKEYYLLADEIDLASN